MLWGISHRARSMKVIRGARVLEGHEQFWRHFSLRSLFLRFSDVVRRSASLTLTRDKGCLPASPLQTTLPTTHTYVQDFDAVLSYFSRAVRRGDEALTVVFATQPFFPGRAHFLSGLLLALCSGAPLSTYSENA